MYSVDSRVAFSDIDSNGFLSPTGILRKLQDCCALQSEDIGFGLRWLQGHRLGWYVVSWQVHIHRLPFMGDAVRTMTLPYLFKGYIGNRNFVMETLGGERLLEANSIWILMDLQENIPHRVPQEMSDAYGLDEPLPIEWRGRKILVPSEREMVYDFIVSAMHCDTNFHMNNTYYLDAAAAALGQGIVPKEFYIEYKRPAHLGDKVFVTTSSGTPLSSASRLQGEEKTVVLESDEGEIFATVLFVL